MTGRLPRILRYELFQICLGCFVLTVGFSGPKVNGCEICPQVRAGHVDDLDGLKPRTGRLDVEENGRLPALNATPELLFRREQEMLIERISVNRDLDPLATSGDNREYGVPRGRHPHVVLQLR